MRVGVVGGGLTGLATVHELAARGIEAVGFEAADEPGGVIRSRRVGDTVLEWGPQRLRAGGIVGEYLEALGLAEDLVVADGDPPIYVYADGALRPVPFDARTLLRTDLLSWRGKARLALEPLTGPAREGETVADYFTRKLGPEAYHAAIEPLLGGLYGSDPAEMPTGFALGPLLRHERGRGVLTRLALRRLRAREPRGPPAVPAGGMQSLPERLYDANRDAVRLATPVERVEPAADGYRLHVPDGAVAVDHVVVATDAPSAARLVDGVDAGAADRLGELTYNPLALVYLRAPVDRPGLGYQVRRDEPLHTLGVSWNGAAFGRDDLHTVFLGGMHEPALVGATDDHLEAIATREFETVMGVEAEALAVHRIEPGMPAYDHSWEHTRGLTTPAGLHLAGNYTARVGIPGRLRQARRVAGRIASDA